MVNESPRQQEANSRCFNKIAWLTAVDCSGSTASTECLAVGGATATRPPCPDGGASERGRLPDNPGSSAHLDVPPQSLSRRQNQWLASSASSESSLMDLLTRSPGSMSGRDVELPTTPLAPKSTGYDLMLRLFPCTLHQVFLSYAASGPSSRVTV